MPSPEQRGGQTDLNINRQSPVIKHELGGETWELTYDNTLIQIFDSPYKHLDHVFITTEEAGPKRVFSDMLIDKLDHARFPKFLQPFPCHEDVEAYVEWQNLLFDFDVAGFLKDAEKDS